MNARYKITVVGQGYVGLPLALALSEHFDVVGYDTNHSRIEKLNNGLDVTDNDAPNNQIANSSLRFEHQLNSIRQSNVYIVTVPTPIITDHNPDLSALRQASTEVGLVLNKNDIVIFESTVFPGATEEECVPLLEFHSNLILNRDFGVGYSPERINPGDTVRTLTNTTKIVSASNTKYLEKIKAIYAKILGELIHSASSIKVAEAAKLIENVQRDVNIALMNEFSQIFHRIDISTTDVLAAASTKWNFQNYKPGLVGGHCIGIDPYYLKFVSERSDYVPLLTNHAREINENIPKFIVEELHNIISNKNVSDNKYKNCLLIGFTFKENCPDVRNTKVYDLFQILNQDGKNVSIWDPIADQGETTKQYGIELLQNLGDQKFDVIIICVAHNCIAKWEISNVKEYLNRDGIIMDIKGIFPKTDSDFQL